MRMKRHVTQADFTTILSLQKKMRRKITNFRRTGEERFIAPTSNSKRSLFKDRLCFDRLEILALMAELLATSDFDKYRTLNSLFSGFTVFTLFAN